MKKSNSVQDSVEKKPTKGQIFKESHSISRTRYKLLRKNGLSALFTKEDIKNANSIYKSKNKERKLKNKKVRQAKHQNAKMNRKVSNKKK